MGHTLGAIKMVADAPSLAGAGGMWRGAVDPREGGAAAGPP